MTSHKLEGLGQRLLFSFELKAAQKWFDCWYKVRRQSRVHTPCPLFFSKESTLRIAIRLCVATLCKGHYCSSHPCTRALNRKVPRPSKKTTSKCVPVPTRIKSTLPYSLREKHADGQHWYPAKSSHYVLCRTIPPITAPLASIPWSGSSSRAGLGKGVSEPEPKSSSLS